MVTFEDVRTSKEIQIYINRAGEVLKTMGYTKHDASHTMKVADQCVKILEHFGFDERTVELGKIAGYLHDIGNGIGRHEHALSGAHISFELLRDLNMDPFEISKVVGAIGSHDETEGIPVDEISAALIIADKCDISRKRVNNKDIDTFDEHDKFNYSVTKNHVEFSENKIILKLEMDNNICSIMDLIKLNYKRFDMCKLASKQLKGEFLVEINNIIIG